MSVTDVGWAAPGALNTIKKKTMCLPGRAWPSHGIFSLNLRECRCYKWDGLNFENS